MIRFLVPLAGLIVSPAKAEVAKASPQGFESKHVVTIAAPPERVWATLIVPSRWWSKDHTYSGDAANLSLRPRAGGCWCETLKDGGSVEHMRIAYAQPGKALRAIGGLGPLQAEGVQGAMTFTLAPDGAGATKLTVSYVVGGYIRAGADVIAAPVDMVLAQQLARLKAASEAK